MKPLPLYIILLLIGYLDFFFSKKTIDYCSFSCLEYNSNQLLYNLGIQFIVHIRVLLCVFQPRALCPLFKFGIRLLSYVYKKWKVPKYSFSKKINRWLCFSSKFESIDQRDDHGLFSRYAYWISASVIRVGTI